MQRKRNKMSETKTLIDFILRCGKCGRKFSVPIFQLREKFLKPKCNDCEGEKNNNENKM